MLRRTLLLTALPCTLLLLSGMAALVANAAPPAVGPQPVEEDMHEFMEYVFQPAYKRLRTAMAVAEPDKATFKVMKAEGLSLAEAGNLLLIRTPDDQADAWKQLSVEVRQHGSALYAAARAKDTSAAQKAYRTMLTSCNACHTKFAGGEHQLTP